MRSIIASAVFFVLCNPCSASLTIISVDRYVHAHAAQDANAFDYSQSDNTPAPGPGGSWTTLAVDASFLTFIEVEGVLRRQEFDVWANQSLSLANLSSGVGVLNFTMSVCADRIGMNLQTHPASIFAESRIRMTFAVSDPMPILELGRSPFTLFNTDTGQSHSGSVLAAGNYFFEMVLSQFDMGSAELDYSLQSQVVLAVQGEVHTLGSETQAVPEFASFAMWTTLGVSSLGIGRRRFLAHHMD